MPTVLLPHEINRFNGVEIRTDHLPASPQHFRRQLIDSLQEWKKNGHSLVWLELPIEYSAYIEPSTSIGFVFHHSAERSLTLLYTLSENATPPTDATHYIGVGGVVFNKNGKLLVVSEWLRRDRSKPYWKLPGGALLPGENLIDGVIREVREETGVDALFEALVGFRHWHGYRWNKSDIYFITRLAAQSSEITAQENEIEEAQWMPVSHYLNHENVSAFNKRAVQAALDSPGISPVDIDGYADGDLFEFFMPQTASLQSTV